MQGEPLAQQIIIGAFGAGGTAAASVIILAWKSLNSKLNRIAKAQHDSILLMFQLLTRLHPNQAPVLNDALQRYIAQKPMEEASPRVFRASSGGH